MMGEWKKHYGSPGGPLNEHGDVDPGRVQRGRTERRFGYHYPYLTQLLLVEVVGQ